MSARRPPLGAARTGGRPAPRREDGQISLFILGLTLVVLLLVVGTVAVTGAQLSRMKLLDTADAAALQAANVFDESGYLSGRGLDGGLPLTDAGVRSAASGYVASRPVPHGIRSWSVDAGTGTSDGRTAVVVMSARAELPMVGPLADALGVEIDIHVVSRAHGDID